MKIRILDRLLVALAGLVLIASCAAIVAQTFFNVQLTDFAANMMKEPSQKRMILIVACAVVLLLIGVYCFLMLFRHRKVKHGFVMQKSDNGELTISLKAMDSMTRKVVERHPEMKLLGTNITPEKDGVIIRLKVALASGVSIPLAVGALQKQITQYVSDCSGVEVREVRVQVDTTDSTEAKPCAYMVPELPGAPVALPQEEEKPAEAVTPVIEEKPVQEEKPVVEEVVAPVAEKIEEAVQQAEEAIEEAAKTEDIDLTMSFAGTPAEYTDEPKQEAAE